MPSKAKPRRAKTPRKPRRGQVPAFHPLTEEALQSHGRAMSRHAWIYVEKHYERRFDPRLVQLCEDLLLNLQRSHITTDPTASKHPASKRNDEGKILAGRKDKGELLNDWEDFCLKDWRRLNEIYGDTTDRITKISTAAATALDHVYFEHMAAIIWHVKNKRPSRLCDFVWYQYEVAYITARYAANETQAPSIDRTIGVLELEWYRGEYVKMGVSNVITGLPSLLPVLPSLPTLGEIEGALVLLKSPTVADVCQALGNPIVVGKRLAESYSRRLSKLKTKEALERQVRATCKGLSLPLQQG